MPTIKYLKLLILNTKRYWESIGKEKWRSLPTLIHFVLGFFECFYYYEHKFFSFFTYLYLWLCCTTNTEPLHTNFKTRKHENYLVPCRTEWMNLYRTACIIWVPFLFPTSIIHPPPSYLLYIVFVVLVFYRFMNVFSLIWFCAQYRT